MVLLFIGCASTEQAKPVAEQFEPLNFSVCKTDEFSGFGVGAHENEALSEAHSALAMQINSSVKVTAEHMVNQHVSNGKENLNSMYESKTTTESILPNAHDARIASKRQNGNNKISIVVCMSHSDAAKGFVERLRPIAASLEFTANAAIEEKHPKLKSEAWHKTQQIWNEFVRLYSVIQGLDNDKAALFEPIAALYAKAKDGYLGYCQTAKLYWNPEQDTPYSEVAFSKLSKNLKLEKASCKGHGISLIYKNTGHECKHSGMFRCSYKPSMLIASCYDEEYRLLENSNVEVFQNVEEVALRKLREKLEYESFWNKWEQEIKQWKPVCE